MITKLGEELTKEALLATALGAGVGGYRANKLTQDEENALREHYRLDDDSDLTLRNAGRGAAGWLGGAVGGGLLGGITGMALGGPTGAALLGQLAGAGLGAYGVYDATNKYSKANAQRILAKKQ